MNETQLFRRSRWQLASWYAGVMGIILSLTGIGVYEAIDHAHRMAADRELQSVAGRLHDNLEPVLQQPGRIPYAAQRFLPDSCVGTKRCMAVSDKYVSHSPGDIFQGNYFIRLLSPSGALIAQAGLKPQGLPLTSPNMTWRFLQDGAKVRYHQLTLPLQNPNTPLWGYLQVGSSLDASDRYLTSVRLILFTGLPLAMAFVGVASWWLAGRAMRPIYQSYQQMQQFTADAAHELRTPIAAAQATVESVMGTSDLSIADIQNTFGVVDRQHQRLSQLIQDLMWLTRLDRQVLMSQHDFCCLQDIAHDIVEELAALAQSKKIQLHTNIQINLPLKVIGDESQLYRLVYNLVVNAIQYTPEGGVVTLSLKERDQQAEVVIQDTGIGIAPEHQAKIFDRFYRVNCDRSRQTGGSGLGLSIAKAIAQTHKGKIKVQSQPNQGSVFTIFLPIDTSA